MQTSRFKVITKTHELPLAPDRYGIYKAGHLGNNLGSQSPDPKSVEPATQRAQPKNTKPSILETVPQHPEAPNSEPETCLMKPILRTQ